MATRRRREPLEEMGEPDTSTSPADSPADRSEADPARPDPPEPRRALRLGAAVIGLVLLLTIAFLMAFLRRQTVSFVSHWIGPPEQTEAWEPLPGEPDLHLLAVGDMGDSGSQAEAVAEMATRIHDTGPVDTLLLLGDNVYPDGDPTRIPETVLAPYAEVLDDAELLAVVGNHDVLGGRGEEHMEALGQPGTRWAVEQGDTIIVGLDSNELLTNGSDQVEWLERTLEDTEATWRIVAVHHPPYSAGYQGSSLEVREKIGPILERHGVQLVLSGHDHDYQRSETVDGVNYMVSGSGSGTRRTGKDDFTAEAFSWLGLAEIGVYPDRMVIRPVSAGSEISDEVEIAPDGSVTELGP